MPKQTEAPRTRKRPLQVILEHERLEEDGWVFVKNSRIHRGRLGAIFYSLCEPSTGLGEQQPGRGAKRWASVKPTPASHCPSGRVRAKHLQRERHNVMMLTSPARAAAAESSMAGGFP